MHNVSFYKCIKIFDNFFIVSSEKASEIETNAVYRLSISFLVPEI